MKFRSNILRRQKLKTYKANLVKLSKRIEFNDLLIRLSTTILSLIKTGDYCSTLAIELQHELMALYMKQTEYFQLSVGLSLHQFRPGPDDPSVQSIRNDYQAVETHADGICKKIDEGLAMTKTEFEKMKDLMELASNGGLRKRAKQNPVGIETELEEATTKANEIKSLLDSLKEKWDGVKDRLNSGIDGCIQQVNSLLQDASAQELGQGEE